MDAFHDSLNDTLKQLIAKALSLPVRSPQRRACLTQIYGLTLRSRRLWRESTPYYGDALQDMWEYCLSHLEEYEPDIRLPTTWFDRELKKCLRRYRDRRRRQQQRTLSPRTDDNGTASDPVDRIPAKPEIQPVLTIWEKTLAWVQSDPTGELQQTQFQGRTDVNARALFLRRFPNETPWQAIADEFGLDAAAAKELPKWYARRCRPLLRQFGREQGYLDPPP